MLKKFRSRLRHFWYYYKVHTVVAIMAVLVFGPPIRDLVTAVRPDYYVAVVSQQSYDIASCDALQTVLDENVTDLNGDGKVKAEVTYYQADLLNPAENDVIVSRLTGDLSAYYSGILLMDDPEAFQSVSFVLAHLDGTRPKEESMELEKMVLPVSEFQMLRGKGFDDLYVGLRLDHPNEDAYRELLEKLK